MSTKNAKIFGLPDLFALPHAAVDAGSVASADYPESNLLTEAPSDTWRSSSYDPQSTYLRNIALVRGANYMDMSIGGLGLVNHNLWPSTGDVRFVLFSGASPTIPDMFEVLVPSSITASSNLNSVVVGDLDNGFINTPGTKAGPLDNTLPWSISVALTDPSADLVPGAGLQTVWIRVNSRADRLPHQALTVTAYLLESGADVNLIGVKSVCREDGHWINFKFNASDLAGISGANLGLRFEMNVDSTLPAPDEYIEIDEIVVLAETVTSMVGSFGYMYDSGWLVTGVPVQNPNATDAIEYLAPELTQGDCLAWDIADTLGLVTNEVSGVQTVAVIIREDHSPDQLLYDVSTFPTMPPGYVEVGHIVGCAAVFSPIVNFTTGPLDGIRDLSTVKFTQGGSQFGQRSGILRTAVLNFPALAIGEKAFLVDRLLRRRGISRPVLVKLMSGGFIGHFEAEAMTIYANLSQAETVASIEPHADYPRSLTLNLVEYR